MALGHVAMAFEPLLFQALGLLIAGNGFFKPNISTIVGGLYGGRSASRRRVHDLLHGHQLGRAARARDLRPSRREGRLALRVLGRGRRDGPRPRAVRVRAEVPGHRGAPSEAGGDAPDGGGRPLPVVRGGRRPGRGAREEGLRRRGGWTAGTCAVWGWLGLWSFVELWAGLPGVVRRGVRGLRRGGAQAALRRDGGADPHAVILVLCAFNIFFWVGFEQAGGTIRRREGGPSSVASRGRVARDPRGRVRSGARRATSRAQGAWLGIFVLFVLFGVLVLISALPGRPGASRCPPPRAQVVNPLLIARSRRRSRRCGRSSIRRFHTSTPTKMAIGMIILEPASSCSSSGRI